jgi:hypothetical protein
MKKPLFLVATTLHSIDVDGPSLVITQRGRARQRFPFRRLSRIVVCGQIKSCVSWIYLALGQGVPITLLEQNGQLLARLQPAAEDKACLPEMAEQLTYDAALKKHWQSWCERQQQHLLSKQCAQLRLSLREVTLNLGNIERQLTSEQRDAVDWQHAFFDNCLSSELLLFGLTDEYRSHREMRQAIIAIFRPCLVILCSQRARKQTPTPVEMSKLASGINKALEPELQRMLHQVECFYLERL